MIGMLEGIRVIDWGVFQVGPYAAALLADMGADVIHVEPPGRGDLLRGYKEAFRTPCVLGDRQINFEEHNRNKRSLTLDLNNPSGREVIYKLVEKSDIFITNYRPESRRQLGMDSETISNYNSSLIYASATGFGEKGPDSNLPSLDMLAQARSGAMMSAGEPDGPPVFSMPNAGDRATATFLTMGVLAALFHRQRTGRGQNISVSQLGSMVVLQGYWLMPVLLLDKAFPRAGRSKPFNALYNTYQCQDGNWIIICLLGRPGEWETFCQTVGAAYLITNELFSTEESRTINATELSAQLDRVFSQKTRDSWEKLFREAGLLATRVNEYSDLVTDPQVTSNDMIMDWAHPQLGNIKFPGFPIHFSDAPLNLRLPAPELGEHTEEILTEWGGYNWEEIEVLKANKVI